MQKLGSGSIFVFGQQIDPNPQIPKINLPKVEEDQMLIQKVLVSQLKPHPDNPRVTLTPDDHEYQQIKKSLEVHGYVQPLIWNRRSGFLISGHQRLPILIAEGMQEIEVVAVDLDPQQEKNLMIALNKITGRWDNEKLAAMLGEFTKIPNFDCEAIGFTVPEVGQIIDRYGEKKDGDDFDFNATLENIKAPVTRRGDVIEVGVHRIMCGDSACESDLNSLMQDEKIDLVHTDPPYGCLYLAQNRPDLQARPKKSKRWEKLYKDDLNEKEYEEWLRSVLYNIRRYLKDGASAYIWNGHAKFYFVHQVLKELGFHVSTVITWAKPTFAISYGDYNQQTEFCIFSWLKNGSHKWYGPTNETNLWEINRDKASGLIHPTQKSVQIPSRAIRNSSIKGDIIFDGFLGSGSSLIAAESLGRRCYGMEIEPKYVDGLILRYINYVGKEKIPQEILDRYCKEAQDGK